MVQVLLLPNTNMDTDMQFLAFVISFLHLPFLPRDVGIEGNGQHLPLQNQNGVFWPVFTVAHTT